MQSLPGEASLEGDMVIYTTNLKIALTLFKQKIYLNKFSYLWKEHLLFLFIGILLELLIYFLPSAPKNGSGFEQGFYVPVVGPFIFVIGELWLHLNWIFLIMLPLEPDEDQNLKEFKNKKIVTLIVGLITTPIFLYLAFALLLLILKLVVGT